MDKWMLAESSGDGYIRLDYCVRNPDDGTVAVYTLGYNKNGNPYKAEIATHSLTKTYGGTFSKDCHFLGGKDCYCGQSFYPYLKDEDDRWRIAKEWAGISNDFNS